MPQIWLCYCMLEFPLLRKVLYSCWCLMSIKSSSGSRKDSGSQQMTPELLNEALSMSKQILKTFNLPLIQGCKSSRLPTWFVGRSALLLHEYNVRSFSKPPVLYSKSPRWGWFLDVKHCKLSSANARSCPFSQICSHMYNKNFKKWHLHTKRLPHPSRIRRGLTRNFKWCWFICIVMT